MAIANEAQLRSYGLLRAYATDWFAALDRHANINTLLPLLADEELEMHFPEGIQKGHAGFRSWYDTVTRRFFDEVHELKEFTVTGQDETRAEIHLVVNWQAKIWDPPEPRSKWLGFNATQTWDVRWSPGTSNLQMVRYVVNALDPMPGSAPL
jgi:hypothetical protein